MATQTRLLDRVKKALRAQHNLYDQVLEAADVAWVEEVRAVAAAEGPEAAARAADAAASDAEKMAKEAETVAKLARSAARAARNAAKGYQKTARQATAVVGNAKVRSAATSAVADRTMKSGAVSEAQRVVSIGDTDKGEQTPGAQSSGQDLDL